MSDSQPDTQDELLDSLLGDFLDEADQLLAQLNENLLELDEWVRPLAEDHRQRCDVDLLNEMFRAAHSLKGLSAMLGLADINNLTHKIENVFDAARKDELTVNGDVVELMFMGLDQLVALVDLLKEPDGEPVDCDAVLHAIRRLLQSAGVERRQTSQADAERAIGATLGEENRESPGGASAHASGSTHQPDPFQDVQDEEEIPDKYLAVFVDETEAALDELTAALLALENGGDGDRLKTLLSIAHKIKGSAAAIGLNRVAKLTHLIEDLLEDLVEAGGRPSPEITDVLLKCTDGLRQYVTGLKGGAASADRFGQLARDLLAVQSGGSPGETGSAGGATAASASPGTTSLTDRTLTDRLECVLAEIRSRLESADIRAVASATGMAASVVCRVLESENVELGILRAVAGYFDGRAGTADGRITYAGKVRFPPDLPAAGLKAQLIFEKLLKLGDVSYCEPPPEKLDETDRLDCLQFQVISGQPLQTLIDQVRVAGVIEVSIRPVDGPPPDPRRESASPRTPVEQAALRPDTASPATEAASNQGSKLLPGPARPDGEESAAGAEVMPGAVEPDAETARGPVPAEGQGEPSPPKPDVVPAPRTPERPNRPQEAKQRGTESGQRPTETVRVDIDRLDHLMDLAGQLVINKSQFSEIGEKLKAVAGCKQSAHALKKVSAELAKMGGHGVRRVDKQHVSAELELFRSQVRRIHNDLEPLRREVRAMDDARDLVRELFEAIHQLHRVSDGIQQSVMDTRMVPIGPLFARFKRVVRDVTRGNGKDVRLEINGEKTELDKRMIDELGDPLVHLVRNAADHGIEPPDEREAAGKPRQGTVTLDAFHRGNSMVIEVRDDGKGLDTDRILRRCLEKGILTKADAERMTPHQLHQMIWEPGLSTAEKVTEVSGRGMGMDIVKSRIEELSGFLDIDSSPGRGTTITIKLPLTLAILPSLMVEISGDVFAMPMEAVSEIVSVGQGQLSTVHGRRVARVRGRVVSLIRLDDFLSFHRPDRAADAPGCREITLVVAGKTGHETGLAVDRVIGEQDIVIKSIAENYKNVPGIAGASILGDGRVALILDVAALNEMVSRKAASVTC